MEKDDNLKYCPRCGAEFLPDTERCVECDVNLVYGRDIDVLPDGPPMVDEEGNEIPEDKHEVYITDTDKFIVAARNINEIQKGIILPILEQENIPYYLSGDQFSTIQMYWSLESKIWVPEKFAEQALAIIGPLLEEFDQEIDYDEQEEEE